MELRALLEITQAINGNLPEEDIFRIFYFTLRGSLDMGKFALFTHSESGEWKLQIVHGTKNNAESNLPDELLSVSGLCSTEELGTSSLEEFDWVYPVRHENRTLAYMLLSSDFKNLEANARLQDRLDFVQALTNIIMVAVENRKLVRRQIQEEAFQRELDMARKVQRLLLPTQLPQTEKLMVEATYFPHHQVGGDYYDFFTLTDTDFLICIADVSGKGMPAAILMSNFQAALKMLVRQGASLEVMVNELNSQIFASSKGDNFITAFFGLYDSQRQTLDYINAGHIPPILVVGSDDCRTLTKGTTMLGAFRKMPFLNFGQETGVKDFTFFGYTDGLSETFNAEDEEFGMKRIETIVCQSVNLDLSGLHQQVITELDKHRQDLPYSDDITIVSCRYSNL